MIDFVEIVDDALGEIPTKGQIVGDVTCSFYASRVLTGHNVKVRMFGNVSNQELVDIFITIMSMTGMTLEEILIAVLSNIECKTGGGLNAPEI